MVSSNVELASLTVFTFMIAVGICNTTSYLVGSSLGQNDPVAARRYAQAACGLTAVLLALAASVFFCTSSFWTGHDSESIRAFPYVCAFMWIDGMQNVLEGIIRGCGLQKIAVWVKIICMLVLRIALCFLLCMWAKLGVAGLWIGSTLAMIVSSTIFAVMLARLDFKERARTISASKEAVSAEPAKVGSPSDV